ncbi:hypothetical protein RMN57_04020 [Kitasatospora sp. CM 4170]|uniref:Uncharacterized protein n=1 Tax=Kitasatospora aburaviensis TaxID=67265 RepID=A0ABW1F6T7_9ACTN|nr:hypothetical protein [Kitasatospora sp. CM 4170]WNM43929.1 hypothetical protein RMN57_04020 [Kitasatospora sp. CM 4170]
MPTRVQLDGERGAAWEIVDEFSADQRSRRRALGAARALSWLLEYSATPP